MYKNRSHWLRVAYLLGFLAAGIPYWLIPYHQVNLPSALISPGLLVVVLAALILRAMSVASFWKVVRILGTTLAAAVLARVIVEGMRDPSSHNLWPFEILIALLLGFACSVAGAMAGSVVVRLRKHEPAQKTG